MAQDAALPLLGDFEVSDPPIEWLRRGVAPDQGTDPSGSARKRCCFQLGSCRHRLRGNQTISMSVSAVLDPQAPAASHRSANPRPFWVFACALLALAAIFYLPYVVPARPSVSLSYEFGYNNRAGLLLTLLFAGVGALWLRQSSLFTLRPEAATPMAPKTLYWGLAGTLVVCAAAWPLVNTPTPVADAGYLINRMQLLASGHKPYVDFEFAYGPFLLYPPVWIARLLHLGIPPAYYLFWVFNELAGVLLLFQVIRQIDIPSRKRAAIFLLFCAASAAIVVLGALSYTFVRFALAPWLAFRICRAEVQGRSAFAGVALSYALLLLISPEIAVSFGLGSLAWLVLRGRRSSVAWGLSWAATLAAMAAPTAIAVRAHLFDTFLSFGSGAHDLPLYPAGDVLLFLVCLFLSVLHLVRQIANREHGASVYLILISLPLLAPALGCCDPLHVFYNGFGILLVGLLCLSQSERGWHVAHLAFFLCFVLLSGLSLCADHFYGYRENLERFLLQGRGAPHIAQAEAFPGSRGILEAPFGFHTTRFETYSAPWMDGGRYFGTLNATSPRDIAIKEEELQNHPDRSVLVPRNTNQFCRLDPNLSRLWIEVNEAAPYWMPQRHVVLPYAKLCEFLHSRYHRVHPATSSSYGYEVWAKNP